MQNAQILFPVNVPGAFDYAVPTDMTLDIGDFVYAPIGKQIKLGVVIGFAPAESGRELKEIAEKKPTRPLSAELIKFVMWTAQYNVTSPGQVLRMVIRSYKALDPSPIVNHYIPTGDVPRQLTSARKAVLEKGGPFPARASEITKRANVSTGVVKGLVKTGAMRELALPVDAPFDEPNPDHPGMALTEGQEDAGKELVAQVKLGGFSVSLLDGVTGSGKTEVYFEEAVAEALRQGGQVLVLVPEIALTQAGMERFEKRFGVKPAAWHSAVGEAPRRRVWREVAQGRAKLVVGARSALYLPFADLKLTVVDEEHDTSYKQEEGVIYNARDMAIVRAKLSSHAVILALPKLWRKIKKP